MYENPFATPEEENVPLTATDYAALAAGGLGATMLGAGLYKGTKRMLDSATKPVRNLAAGVGQTETAKKIKNSINNAVDTATAPIRNTAAMGGYSSSPYGRVSQMEDFTGFIPEQGVSLKGRSTGALKIDPIHVEASLRTLRDDLTMKIPGKKQGELLPAPFEKIVGQIRSTPRLQEEELNIMNKQLDKLKLKGEDRELVARLTNNLKGAMNMQDPLITSPKDVDSILGLYSALVNK